MEGLQNQVLKTETRFNLASLVACYSLGPDPANTMGMSTLQLLQWNSYSAAVVLLWVP